MVWWRIGFGLLKICFRGDAESLYHLNICTLNCFAKGGRLGAVKLHEVQTIGGNLLLNISFGSIYKDTHAADGVGKYLHRFGRQTFGEACRTSVEDKAHVVDSLNLTQGSNVVRLLHTAYFYLHDRAAIKVDRAAAGSNAFIKHSPMRQPEKPAARSSSTVSGV